MWFTKEKQQPEKKPDVKPDAKPDKPDVKPDAKPDKELEARVAQLEQRMVELTQLVDSLEHTRRLWPLDDYKTLWRE